MATINTFIFDSADELVYDTSKIEVITTIDDETSYNPFSFSGIIGTFGFVASGSPYNSPSGEIVSFDFGEPRKLKSFTVEQDPLNYAVSYSLKGGLTSANNTLINVSGSINSGNIYHLLANPVEVRYVDFTVFEVAEGNTSYTIYNVSGEANPPFLEEKIALSAIETIIATSNVEPVENLYDDNDLTFWQSNNSFPQEVLFKFRNSNNVSKFDYISEDSTTFPTSYTIYKSLDGETFDQIVNSGSISATSGSVIINPIETTKYLKWKITGGNSNKVRIREVSIYKKTYEEIDVNQIKLKKTVTDAMPLVPSLMASSNAGSSTVANLIAGVSGYWQTNSSMTLSNGFYVGSEYITFNFTDATTIDSMLIQAYLNDGMPVDFVLQGSDDNATFTTIRTITGNAQEDISISFADNEYNEYLFYKLVFTKSTDAYIKLKELNFNVRSYTSEASIVLPSVMIDKLKSADVDVSEVDLLNRDIKYMINIDNRNYWFNGQAFVQSNGTFNQSNALGDLNANFERLTLSQNSKVSLVAVMTSNGTSTPVLNSASLTSQNLANAPYIPANQVRIRGYVAGHVGKPLEMTVSLKRPIKIDGQTVAHTVQTIKSDNNGWFDFVLPVLTKPGTVPFGEKFSVIIQPLNYRVERTTPDVPTLDLAKWLSNDF